MSYATPLLLRVREAARWMGVTDRTVRHWIQHYGLPHIRLGRAIRIPSDALRDWIARQAEARKEGGAA